MRATKKNSKKKKKRIKPTQEKKKENFTLCLIRPKTHPTEMYEDTTTHPHSCANIWKRVVCVKPKHPCPVETALNAHRVEGLQKTKIRCFSLESNSKSSVV